MIINGLQQIAATQNGDNRLFYGDVSGKYADSFGVITNLMLDLMSVEI
jgi:hypothetical protein